MNTQQYIQSGKLEAYLIGVTSDEDTKEVEAMMTLFPEVSLAVSNLETDVIAHLSTNAVTPPPNLRERLAFDNSNNEIKPWSFAEQTFTQPENNHSQSYIEVEFDNTHIKVHKYWRPAFIAVFILGKIFLASAIYFYFKAESVKEENTRLKQELEIHRKK